MLTLNQKRLRLAKRIANRRQLQRIGQYPKPEEQIQAGPQPPVLGTYTPPPPYRVLRLVKK